MFWHFEGPYPYTEADGSVLFFFFIESPSLSLQLGSIIMSTKKLKWLVVWKYNNEEMIVIDSNDGGDDDETLAWFMPSNIDTEMDSSRDSLASFM